MTNRIALLCVDTAFALMLMSSVDKSLGLYVLGIICILSTKIALVWNDEKEVTFKAVFITIILSITGGYIGYLVGLVWFESNEFLRLIILLAFVYLGDTILIGIKTQSPELLKDILKGGANAIIKKMGGKKDKQDENNEQF